jgi:uncharacterized protein (DUF1330 family)
MSAYVIVDVEVTDPEGFEKYRQMAPLSIELYGGKYIARGGDTEVFEGNWQPERIVILEFESLQQAADWHRSEEYREAKTLRNKTANSNMIAVAGVS